VVYVDVKRFSLAIIILLGRFPMSVIRQPLVAAQQLLVAAQQLLVAARQLLVAEHQQLVAARQPHEYATAGPLGTRIVAIMELLLRLIQSSNFAAKMVDFLVLHVEARQLLAAAQQPLAAAQQLLVVLRLLPLNLRVLAVNMLDGMFVLRTCQNLNAQPWVITG
jgi:hypothetical protein